MNELADVLHTSFPNVVEEDVVMVDLQAVQPRGRPAKALAIHVSLAALCGFVLIGAACEAAVGSLEAFRSISVEPQVWFPSGSSY